MGEGAENESREEVTPERPDAGGEVVPSGPEQPSAPEPEAPLRRVRPGRLIATRSALVTADFAGRATEALRTFLLGPRLPTHAESGERLSRLKGLAVFATDNVSSSAYATEEIMRVLVLAGIGALSLALPTTLMIAGVLGIVVLSYLQLLPAYPAGGGSYSVVQSHLGRMPALVTAAALMTDYVLTVAVSVAAGLAAISSIFPAMHDHRVLWGIALILILMIGNLRGIRESANVFAGPTLIYVLSVYGLIGYGLIRLATGSMPEYHAPPSFVGQDAVAPLTLLLLLRAFSSGAVALTGIEAVADGIPAFKPRESHNAQVVLMMMATLFVTLFVGISFLAGKLGIVPDPTERETVMSMLAGALAGQGSAYHYLVQFATALVLVFAANTSFNGFPRLASIVAAERFLPRQFKFRGDRLAFTVGIVALGATSALLLALFKGSVAALIPLYTVGVFLAFTLSQAGMVRYWWERRGQVRGWWWRMPMNGVGAACTGVVLLVVSVAKFSLGAWVVLLLIPLLVGLMLAIRNHYDDARELLQVQPGERMPEHTPHLVVVVPVSRIERPVFKAVSYARHLSDDVRAVHIAIDPENAEVFQRHWEEAGMQGVPLVVVDCPYRELMGPLTSYLKTLEDENPGRSIAVVLPTYVTKHLWEFVLHNQTSFQLKLRLFFRRNTVVMDVPYHLSGPWSPPTAGGRRRHWWERAFRLR